MNFKQTIATHTVAIILALLTAISIAAPQIYFRIDHAHDGVYQGIELLPDSPWSARAREVQDGHPNFGAIYYKDGKDNPYLFQPLGSMVVAYMGEAGGLDVNNTFLLSRLVLTFLVFLLIYSFVFLLSREKLVALSSAALLLLGQSLLSLSGLKDLLHGVSPEDFLNIARPVNPAMIYVLLFSFLIAFWLFYKNRKVSWGVVSALLLGLNFYNYFYSWTYLYAFGGVLVLLLLVQKKWREALTIASVFVGAVVVAIPYGINLYRATLHANYAEAALRNGIIQTHAPLFVGFVVIGVLALFLWKFPREHKETFVFGLALLLAPFITMNQQILTGKVLQASHYHWFFHKPIGVIFALIIVFYLLTRPALLRYRTALAIGIIVVSVGTGLFIQMYSYVRGTNDGGAVAIERQKYGPAMRWLNENAPPESVILGNDETSHIVAIYTSLNLFYHRAGMYSLAATPERLIDAQFFFYRLRGVDAADVRSVFFEERGLLSANIYGMHYRELLGAYEAIQDEQVEEIVALYIKSLSVPAPVWLKQTWAKYNVSYLIWDKKNDPLWHLEKYPFLKEAAVFGTISIYQFNQQ